MSSNEVDLMIQAIHHADNLHHDAPYSGMTIDQIDRRYAEWVVEYIKDHGWALGKWIG